MEYWPTCSRYCRQYVNNEIITVISIIEGDVRKAKEEELQKLMNNLETKYSPLHVVDVYEKLGKPEVNRLCLMTFEVSMIIEVKMKSLPYPHTHTLTSR